MLETHTVPTNQENSNSRIALASGLELPDPWELLRPMREQDDWYAYDGAATFEDDELGMPEILLSIALGSGVTNPEAYRLFKARAAAGPWLRRLPAALKLHDASEDDLDNLTSLIGALRITDFSLARLTKILHKKRPRLIRVIDWYVERYYLDVYRKSVQRRQLPSNWSDKRRWLTVFRLMQADLRNGRDTLEAIKERLGNEGREFSLCRLLSHLI